MAQKTDKAAGKAALERISLLKENLSLAEFCDRVGWNYRAAQKSYQRKSLPDSELLVKIASAFRVDLKWLVTGEIDPLVATAAKKFKLFRKKKGWSFKLLEEKIAPALAHICPASDEKSTTTRHKRSEQKELNPAGIVAQTLDLFEKGNLGITMDLLRSISGKMDIPLHEFLHEDEPTITQIPELKVFQASSTRESPHIRNEDYVSIPLTSSSIAAGQPIIAENDIEDYVLLHVRAAGRRNNLVACKVDGVSMEPMLHSGDIVVIDRDDRKIAKNKMYAVFYDEGLTAKYIERQKDLLILRPINPNAQVQVVNLVENPDPIVGRIIGAWKEL
jgi:phage repressor protein C with HTH and peptisase S24 domain